MPARRARNLSLKTKEPRRLQKTPGFEHFAIGGEGGIRTHGEFPHTRFPSVPIRPLSHSSRLQHPEVPQRKLTRYRESSPGWNVTAGSCATSACEPSQDGNVAALNEA